MKSEIDLSAEQSEVRAKAEARLAEWQGKMKEKSASHNPGWNENLLKDKREPERLPTVGGRRVKVQFLPPVTNAGIESSELNHVKPYQPRRGGAA